MTNPFVPGIGAILSADIAVPEYERELSFYSRVLTTGESPLWREDLMNNLGMPIIGLGPQSPEYAHIPLQWMPHIQVGDVQASVERALDLGGSELMHAKDDAGKSQWAVLLDLNGASFGIIPVVPAEAIPTGDGSELPEPATSVGRIGWADLTVPDASASQNFYQQVVGWPVQHLYMDDGGERYTDVQLLGNDGIPVAGIRHGRGVNADLPPVWLICLPVGDLAESVRRVEEEGGGTIKATQGADGEHIYTVVRDPVGACLGLMEESR